MDSIRASDLAGNPIRLTQVNKGRWRISGTAKGARIDYAMFVKDPGPYGAELNQQHAFLNLAEILVYADTTRYQESQVKFENVPQGWKVVAVQPGPAAEITAEITTFWWILRLRSGHSGRVTSSVGAEPTGS